MTDAQQLARYKALLHETRDELARVRAELDESRRGMIRYMQKRVDLDTVHPDLLHPDLPRNVQGLK